MTDTERVKGYYDDHVDAEWRRLKVSWLKYAITRHFIAANLEPVSVVLDVGGGPGRYALDLAAEGHVVDLADISPGNIAFAEERARRTGVKLQNAMVRDACDLSCFPDASFDMVLNLGPLYHLTCSEDLVRAVQETLRVLKPDGSAFLLSFPVMHLSTST